MQIGIRAHDVAGDTLEEAFSNIEKQGFVCAHLAMTKSVKSFKVTPETETPGLAKYVKHLAEKHGLDIAVLGNYNNLCNPDPQQLKSIQYTYTAALRFGAALGCSVVGTETGAVNTEYVYEPANGTEEALNTFITNLRPVVRTAEKLGVVLAIEPVVRHVVCSVERARRVLDAIDSPNLQIIYDPVNLLWPKDVPDQDAHIRKAFDLLGPEIAVIHCKDFIIKNGEFEETAAGLGGLDYPLLCREIKKHKPYIQCTLENTTPETAVAAREFLQKTYDEA
ncbi:MAG: sugar phosphate isomerase/epimerase [Lachnospiraceae bacterium]|nr:sugar phosphate isomerase/epimerase [Lachnospiraceae bacterium]MCH4029984.1 sugar phosphate isomerase/epimerase [Lachnospiraceae bacterium]MCH4070355.1 sugar phosphate isomerase/epimerase [Lachnospiraceae bacterium]MCI1331582.1 sugar phosphate isomerase/epimerase [Lachnospiraceae bacterium]MCI1361039.1 sugar phosphate isomerase/epimerase [Lachnospiraceae bacterium]